MKLLLMAAALTLGFSQIALADDPCAQEGLTSDCAWHRGDTSGSPSHNAVGSNPGERYDDGRDDGFTPHFGGYNYGGYEYGGYGNEYGYGGRHHARRELCSARDARGREFTVWGANGNSGALQLEAVQACKQRSGRPWTCRALGCEIQ